MIYANQVTVLYRLYPLGIIITMANNISREITDNNALGKYCHMEKYIVEKVGVLCLTRNNTYNKEKLSINDGLKGT